MMLAQSTNKQRIALGAVLLVGALATGVRASASWAQVVFSPLVFLLALWLSQEIYFWQRSASYERRTKRREQFPAHDLSIPTGVRKPEAFGGGKHLHEAQWKYLNRAVEAQGHYFANGIRAAVLSPAALLLLALQVLIWPHGGGWAFGLILSEAFCLGTLLYLVWTAPEPTAEWIGNRLRCEILRREQYLLVAGVGPYLGYDESSAARMAATRRGQIEGTDFGALSELVPLQDYGGKTWMEHLYVYARQTASTDCLDRMECYLHQRLGKQLLWFANELRDCEENERFASQFLKLTLLCAIVVAFLHGCHLYHGLEAGDAAEGSIASIAIGLFGITLPPVATAVFGIQAMYNFRGRSRIYSREKGLLHGHHGELLALVQEAKAPSRSLDDIDFDFRALVLRTESSLTLELSQWLLLMYRAEHEAGA